MFVRDETVWKLSYGYMIDNIMLLITGALHERDISELIAKCHPLGMFENIGALSDKNLSELYNTVIVDTPLGSSFSLLPPLLFFL